MKQTRITVQNRDRRDILKQVALGSLLLVFPGCNKEASLSRKVELLGTWKGKNAVPHAIIKKHYRFTSLVFEGSHKGHYSIEVTDVKSNKSDISTLDFFYTLKGDTIYYLAQVTTDMMRTKLNMSEKEILNECQTMPVKYIDANSIEVRYYGMKMILKRS